MQFQSCFLFLLLAVLSFASPIDCHNWLGSAGRAVMASTYYPFPLKWGNQAHFQIGPNQTFPLEWSTGHGNTLTLFNQSAYIYFTILHSDDQDKIPLTSRANRLVIEDYIRSAPLYATTPVSVTRRGYEFNNLTADRYWAKNHLLDPYYTTGTGTTINMNFVNNWNATVPKYFTYRTTTMNDPNFVYRDPQYLRQCKAGYCKNVNNPGSQWVYKDEWRTKDLRYEYYNPNYPWIEAVHRFEISPTETIYAGAYNTARFRIPARKGPGNYLVWFNYQHGYFDVVDVNVQPQNVTFPFGKPPQGSASMTYAKIPHCEFASFRTPSTRCRLINRRTMNVSQCLDECMRNGGCEEVQVSRVSNLPGSLTMIPNIPTVRFNGTQTDMNGMPIGPCGWLTVKERTEKGCGVQEPMCDLQALGAQPDDYVCWGSPTVFNIFLQATNPWTVVADPEDPMFYSTCYRKIAKAELLPHPPYPVNKDPWQVGDYCVNCNYLNKTRFDPLEIAPNWEGNIIFAKEGQCRNCQRLGLD